ncbi:class A beta-lactamase [Xanthobacter sp. 126]|uniref:class A beta-lactamase n=1 Tax=Xanthobacter sp. 126 TaxID=1131814 RepID=UPI0004B00B62
MTVSDNTAANLLLEALGGPLALTAFVRTLGDASTRVDRVEPDLNQATPGDPRDTTTPAAIARDMLGLSTGITLSAASRERLNGWLIACATGTAKLRAGLPADWRAGDKTGSGSHGTSNDVAVIWPPGRPPLVIASYLTQAPGDDARRNGIHAAVARAVATLDG